MGIAHSSEQFRRYIDWATIAPTGDHYWVGDAPRLSTMDEATSYARFDSPASETVIATATLAPFTLSSVAVLSAQARVRGGAGAPYTFEAFLTDEAGAGAFGLGYLATDGDWGVFSVTFDPADIDSYIKTAATSGEVTIGARGPLGVSADGVDVSWLDLSTGRIPTRVYPRADGLGMGAPRLMDGRSPYRSPRVFGQI